MSEESVRNRKILVFGTMYVADDARLEVLNQWFRCLDAQRFQAGYAVPAFDVALIDSASSDIVARALAETHCDHYFDFGDNIGHLAQGGRDGWGRAFCFGLEMAINRGYEYAVHIESDLLCRIPIAETCERMTNSVVTTRASLYSNNDIVHYPMAETGVMFMKTAFLRDRKVIERYNWSSPKHTRETYPELDIVTAMGPENVDFWDWRGCRDDQQSLSDARGFDYLTHASSTARASFMEGIA